MTLPGEFQPGNRTSVSSKRAPEAIRLMVEANTASPAAASGARTRAGADGGHPAWVVLALAVWLAPRFFIDHKVRRASAWRASAPGESISIRRNRDPATG